MGGLGTWPEQDGVSGSKREFKKYQEARAEMIARLGEYCSFCEMHLDAGLAVEHVRPKKPQQAVQVDQQRLLDWHNFLLACPNCNRIKSNQDVCLADYLWPDRDNTFRALTYSEGGIVGLVSDLNGMEKFRAEQTLCLTGLDRQPDNDPCASDRRWSNRREAWDLAWRYKDRISKSNAPDEIRECALDVVRANGYWSVWMTVFADDVVMQRSLIEALPGTSRQSFDDNCQAIPRPGGLY